MPLWRKVKFGRLFGLWIKNHPNWSCWTFFSI